MTDVVDGVDTKFHSAGHEDVDALILGMGRPFVVGIIEPYHRTAGVE